ncbi:DeoR/GlpR family DNA-binding transcription regulator [Muricomes intestini]|jgi:DeoR/GlpR family transcriptional regulator of sugar metabolism|uniref:DeoR family transcriptional regulator n=1 Tax=Muricomes intestini TaxID=1796634 RepID=A0A4R3KD57_9FIRM|nr:DeoR/GlpR family DNA-binding transcription regulator [Muricomes intestini]TCS81194.1 DeoR family transcriptional regulator [Muricomes intestini]HAX52512.1 hypothetical protein [Lachnospiraceae bacterium]HCR81819.1 hypothetical protein [Lachnospiraceae bacterium]
MLKEKRLQKIQNLLIANGSIETSQLSRTFAVTEMTIRRDLETLIKENPKIVRTHGGAMLSNSGEQVELPYEQRMSANSELKYDIAQTALSFIRHGQVLFIDSGTTTLHLARQITNEFNNTVITNGINIATELLTRDWVNVILIGGDLRKNTRSTRGPLAEEQMRNFKVDVAFLGANAIGSNGNIYLANTSEIGFKKSVLAAAKEVYVLADSNKFNKFNLISCANGRDVTGIITDCNLPHETIETLEELDVHLITATK